PGAAFLPGPEPHLRHRRDRNPAAQQAPDLMLINPLCCLSRQRLQTQFDRLKRRDLFTLLGVGATWPLAADAQPSARRPTLGLLIPGSPASYGQHLSGAASARV